MRALQVVYLRVCAGLFRCETPYDFENFRLWRVFRGILPVFQTQIVRIAAGWAGQSDGSGGLGGNNAVLLERA